MSFEPVCDQHHIVHQTAQKSVDHYHDYAGQKERRERREISLEYRDLIARIVDFFLIPTRQIERDYDAEIDDEILFIVTLADGKELDLDEVEQFVVDRNIRKTDRFDSVIELEPSEEDEEDDILTYQFRFFADSE